MGKVLFIIKVDIRSENIICADITEMSEPTDQTEVLFNIGSVFYIDEIEFNHEQQLWRVFPIATEDRRTAANDYMNTMPQQWPDTNISIVFGQLLQLGKYLLELLEHSNENRSDYLTVVFQHQARNQSNNLDLARTKNALGWIYHSSGELKEAITYYNEVLCFAEESISFNHLVNAQSYSLLGGCYLEKSRFDKAQNYYEKALQIESLPLPFDHPGTGAYIFKSQETEK